MSAMPPRVRRNAVAAARLRRAARGHKRRARGIERPRGHKRRARGNERHIECVALGLSHIDWGPI